MICEKCKKEIPDGSLFCCWCGKSMLPKRSHKRRGNGQGCVFKCKNGYAAEITLGYYMDGDKRKRKMKRRTGFTTKKAALEYIATFKPETVRTVPNCSQLYETFMQYTAPSLSKSKQGAYRIAWERIKPEIAFRKINSFTVSELQDITDEAAPSYYTRRDIKSLFSHLYKLAVRDDVVTDNKAQFIQLPKLVTSERAVFSLSDIAALWSDYKNSQSKIVGGILIMLYTGIRPAELLSIRTENIHLDEHYMTGGVKTEKGKRRKLIIPNCIIPIIADLSKNSDYLCKICKTDFYDGWQEKRSSLGLPESLTPYCCRHTYITDLTSQGVSPAMLQELAGHEDYETTLLYTHLSVDDRLAAVNRLYRNSSVR